MVQKSLAEGSPFLTTPRSNLIFRDAISGLEYIRNCRDH
jgi:hypothetical protein